MNYKLPNWSKLVQTGTNFRFCFVKKKTQGRTLLERFWILVLQAEFLHPYEPGWVACVSHKMVVFIGGLMHSWPIIMVAACNAICFNVAAPVQRLRYWTAPLIDN